MDIIVSNNFLWTTAARHVKFGKETPNSGINILYIKYRLQSNYKYGDSPNFEVKSDI
jgi:hypothetical protein